MFGTGVCDIPSLDLSHIDPDGPNVKKFPFVEFFYHMV